MNRTEASALLTYIARVDNRNIDRELIEVWAELLDDVTLADAIPAAREHLRGDSRWLTPAILRERVEAANPPGPERQSVAEAHRVPDTGGNDSGAAYVAALRAGRFQAPGLPVARPVAAITAGGTQ